MGLTWGVALVALGAILGGTAVGVVLAGVIRRLESMVRVLSTPTAPANSLADDLFTDRHADTVRFRQPAFIDARPERHQR